MDDLLRNEIITGVQKLFSLRLPGAPAADAVGMTAAVWIEALAAHRINWDAHQDAPRIQRAFQILLRADRWPVPKDLIAALPPRPEPLRLPEPPLTAAELETRRARIRALREMLATATFKPMPKGE